MTKIERCSIIKQTAQNMVEAGVVKTCEYGMFVEQLKELDIKDLMTVLVESHKFREQAPERISFYPIDVDAISKN